MMKTSWVMYAFGAAFFAALTAVFGKLGVSGLNSNLATLIRTVVVLALLAAIVAMRGEWQRPSTIPAHSWLFLLLSGAATGLSSSSAICTKTMPSGIMRMASPLTTPPGSTTAS